MIYIKQQPNHYKTLCVFIGSSIERIKRSYYLLARTYYNNEAQFTPIVNAYNILNNKASKDEYDRTLKESNLYFPIIKAQSSKNKIYYPPIVKKITYTYNHGSYKGVIDIINDNIGLLHTYYICREYYLYSLNNEHDYKTLIKEFEKYAYLYYENINLLEIYLNALFELKDYKKIEDVFNNPKYEKDAKLEPNCIYIYLNALSNSKKYDLLISIFYKYKTITHSSLILIHLGMYALKKEKKYIEIEKLFVNLINITKIDQSCIISCIYALNRMEKYTQAFYLIEKQKEYIKYYDEHIIEEISITLYKMKKWDDLYKLFNEHNDIEINSINCISKYMFVLNRLGKYEKTVKIFNKYDNDKAHMNAFTVRLCMFALNKLKRYNEAVNLFDRHNKLTLIHRYSIYECLTALKHLGRNLEVSDLLFNHLRNLKY